MRLAIVLALGLEACGGAGSGTFFARSRAGTPASGALTAAAVADDSDTTSARRLRIVFEGNHALPEEVLRSVMKLPDVEGQTAPPDDNLVQYDVLALNALYYDHGYLDVQIPAPTLDDAHDGAHVDVRIHIDEGSRYRVGHFDLVEKDADGNEVAALGGGKARLLSRFFHIDEGDWFNRKLLVDGISSVQTIYRDAGYGSVEVTPETDIAPDGRVVDLHTKIVRGPLTYFSRIVIDGALRVPLSVIRSKIVIREGGLYSETGLEQTRTALQRMVEFSRVDISTESAPDKTHITVHIEVDEHTSEFLPVAASRATPRSRD